LTKRDRQAAEYASEKDTNIHEIVKHDGSLWTLNKSPTIDPDRCVGTCANCMHWIARDAGDDTQTFGDCHRVMHYAGGSREKGFRDNQSIHDEPAVVVDGSGYFARLRTKANFSCILWEQNTTQDHVNVYYKWYREQAFDVEDE